MTSRLNQPMLPLRELNNEQLITATPNTLRNDLQSEDEAIHSWYRFVLSFPPHLVRHYIEKFHLDERHLLLDPFCGTGTTLVEARLCGIPSVGIEANPVTHLVSQAKLNWSIDIDEFLGKTHEVAERALAILQEQGIDDFRAYPDKIDEKTLRRLPPKIERLLIKNSISPLPLHKTLVLSECLNAIADKPYYEHALVALAKALVFSISNLRFGPEVGIGKIKPDSPVLGPWLAEVRQIAGDLRNLSTGSFPEAAVHLGDARELARILKPHSINAVITSPPYPNEKDYSRTTRLESVLLGFMTNTDEMRAIKKRLIRSNTRGVYKADEDDRWIRDHPEISELAERIERRRIALGKTSGFERLYARVTRLYFGGMAKHLSELRTVLRRDARLAFVVGDQASYFQVMIRTGELLARIAERYGYRVESIDLFRTRLATATGEQLREEIVVLTWPNKWAE